MGDFPCTVAMLNNQRERVIPSGSQEIQSVSAEAILGMIDDLMIHLQLDANQSGQDQWSWSNLGMEKSSI